MAALRPCNMESNLEHRYSGRAEDHDSRAPQRPVEQHDFFPHEIELDGGSTCDILGELSNHSVADGSVSNEVALRTLRLAAALLLSLSARISAQAVTSVTPSGSAPVSPVTRADSGRAEIEIALPSVTVAGAPRSYQVVSIPVPDAMAQLSDVQLVII